MKETKIICGTGCCVNKGDIPAESLGMNRMQKDMAMDTVKNQKELYEQKDYIETY